MFFTRDMLTSVKAPYYSHISYKSLNQKGEIYMEQLKCKYSLYVIAFIVFGFGAYFKPHSVIAQGMESTGTATCKPKTIMTHPVQELVMQKGKNANIVVNVKCKGDKPAAGVQVNADILKGKNL